MAARYMHDVLPTLAAWRAAGLRTALVTIVFVDGSAPRPLGSQMAINERGEAVGNLTGGCAEAAIIAEAVACIDSGVNHVTRYGKGSPYIDLRLPCGSGIDVFFDVTLAQADLDRLVEAGAARVPIGLGFDFGALKAAAVAPDAAAPYAYVRVCEPATRLYAVGKGPVLPLIAELGAAAEFDVIALSPEAETLALALPHAREARTLTTPDAFDCGRLDRWTAFVSLFHEHEWEPPVLRQALASDCFYIGALGSRRAAMLRREALAEAGVAAADILRIRAPVGLSIGARSPPEIALAILAEIVAVRRGVRA